MCPVWGQHKWAEAKWGYDALPPAADVARRVLSANHPWLNALGIHNYWREGAFEIWRVDATTLADVARLPHIAGGVRTSNLADAPFQTETLALSFLDPSEYLEGGIYAPLVPLGQLLRLRWQVSGAAGVQTLDSGIYRVVTLPTATVDSEGTQEPVIQCEDWLAEPLRKLMLDGADPMGAAVQLRDQGLPLGMPIVWNVDTYATLVAAVIWTASGHRLRVPEAWRTLNYWGTSSPQPTQPPPPAPPPPAPGAPQASVSVTPASAPRGGTTTFNIGWSYFATDMTPDDAIFWTQDNVSQDNVSIQAAGEPAGSIYRLPTGGAASGQLTPTLTPDFGAGNHVRFWYWHRTRGCLADSALVYLL